MHPCIPVPVLHSIIVQDQVRAVHWYAEAGLVDLTRVGVFGWSYGGYLSAMAVCRSPFNAVFRCGVAGAPVTSWDGYDTHYTERYMGLPAENEAGYASSAVMTHTASFPAASRLLLVHGLIDENVHFRHTARLINGLIAHRKRYDLVLFPCERHAPHKHEDRAYLEDRLSAFFDEGLRAASAGTATATATATGTGIATSVGSGSAASRPAKHALDPEHDQSQGQDQGHVQNKRFDNGGSSNGVPAPPARL